MLVCVVGNFGDTESLADGQRIKTIELYRALVKQYGEQQVTKVNLHGKSKLRLTGELLVSLMRCRNLIVLVSKNGRKTVIPLLVMMNTLFRRRIWHALIASTTHETLEQFPRLVKIYNRLSGNWAETRTEMKLLQACGLKNVSVVKNFKNLTIPNKESLVYQTEAPFRFCTFSRIEAPKGIAEAVEAIRAVNQRFGRTVCTLDLYGQVMPAYEEEFAALQKTFCEDVRYMGVADFGKSVETLKQYYMLLFPTKYFTEGIPGTIIDALSAGVPVICSEWESCYDIMTDAVGLTYAFDDTAALTDAIAYAVSNPACINAMKPACLAEARNYAPERVIEQISACLE